MLFSKVLQTKILKEVDHFSNLDVSVTCTTQTVSKNSSRTIQRHISSSYLSPPPNPNQLDPLCWTLGNSSLHAFFHSVFTKLKRSRANRFISVSSFYTHFFFRCSTRKSVLFRTLLRSRNLNSNISSPRTVGYVNFIP